MAEIEKFLNSLEHKQSEYLEKLFDRNKDSDTSELSKVLSSTRTAIETVLDLCKLTGQRVTPTQLCRLLSMFCDEKVVVRLEKTQQVLVTKFQRY